MTPTLVLDIAGLSKELIGKSTPRLAELVREGGVRTLEPVFPALTCPVQATFCTGELPRAHGAVGNGWYLRDLAEIALWKSSDHLISGERIWDAARKRDPGFTVAKLFWSFGMYGSTDVSVTPRTLQHADGLELEDIYTEPPTLREELFDWLGAFPRNALWGPQAGIASTRWIAQAAEHVLRTRCPTLTLVRLPHLEYDLQRHGPHHANAARPLAQLDEVCGSLLDFARQRGLRIIVLSEYAITDVSGPVYLNRVLREAGLLRVRDENGHESLDVGGSDAFALCDHQIAHVYVKCPEILAPVRRMLEALPGVDRVLGPAEKHEAGVDHARAGELVAVSAPDRWFCYYYWRDAARAPDYARCVDSRRKPGHDPAELFVDPALKLPFAKIAWTSLKQSLGLRCSMDVVPLDPSIVRGSHGRLPVNAQQSPVLLSTEPALLPDHVHATDVKQIILDHLFEQRRSTVHSRSALPLEAGPRPSP